MRWWQYNSKSLAGWTDGEGESHRLVLLSAQVVEKIRQAILLSVTCESQCIQLWEAVQPCAVWSI